MWKYYRQTQSDFEYPWSEERTATKEGERVNYTKETIILLIYYKFLFIHIHSFFAAAAKLVDLLWLFMMVLNENLWKIFCVHFHFDLFFSNLSVFNHKNGAKISVTRACVQVSLRIGDEGESEVFLFVITFGWISFWFPDTDVMKVVEEMVVDILMSKNRLSVFNILCVLDFTFRFRLNLEPQIRRINSVDIFA